MKYIETFEGFLYERREFYTLTPKYWDESVEEQFEDFLDTIENTETGKKGVDEGDIFWSGPPMSVRREMELKNQERGIESDPNVPTIQIYDRNLYLIVKGYLEKSGLL